MIIDTHCHYNLEPLSQAVDTHWNTAQAGGVLGAVCVGTSLETSKLALKQAAQRNGMLATIGIHPNVYTDFIKTILNGNEYDQAEIAAKSAADTAALTKLCAQHTDNKKFVGIGEIGLDYFRLKTKGLKRELVIALQKTMLRAQLKLAHEYSLPVILHVRDKSERTTQNAYYDTLEIVREVMPKDTKATLILHCVSGPSDYHQSLLDLGAYIGVAGNVTYDTADDIRSLVSNTPAERILLETDAPYLAPAAHKGMSCQPVWITQTAEFLQTTYNINLAIIKANTLKVFPQFASELTE